METNITQPENHLDQNPILGAAMRMLRKTIRWILPLAAVGMISACDGGGPSGEKALNDVPVTPDTTSADLAGVAIKGTLADAVISVQQLSGANVTIDEGVRTGSDGSIALAVAGDPGFGIDGAMKVSASADHSTAMVCDAAACGVFATGDILTGADLGGVVLSTLAYVSVPFASTADGTVDADFNINALTTLATSLLESQIAAGRNASSAQLFTLAQLDVSETVLRGLGIDMPNTNIFEMVVVSAEAADNFLVGKECTTDDEGVKTCIAVQDPDTTRLSLVNASFANLGPMETFEGVLADTSAALLAALDGDVVALDPVRARLSMAVSAHPLLAELGVAATDIIDTRLAFVERDSDINPVQEITTVDNLAAAMLSARFSISDSESAAQAFDGDVNTKWLDHNQFAGAPTKENPAWIQVDFATPQAVSGIVIVSANDAENRDPENFNLAGSNDGGNTWVTLAEFVGESFDERFQRREFRFSNGLKYLTYRLNITKNRGDDTLMQIAEIEFVGPIVTSVDQTDANIGVYTARNRISDAEAEQFAFDNDPNTKWLDHNDFAGAPTEEAPSWVQVDFPSAVPVRVVAITSANDADSRDPENFNLVGSNDGGVSWVLLGEFVGESFDERFERKAFDTGNTLPYQTYRLNITKNRGDDTLMQVGEIELIGPTVADVKHSHDPGAAYVGRNRISDGEAEPFAFDNDINTKWLDHNDFAGAPTPEDPSFIEITLPELRAVNKLALTSANDAESRDPENFFLEASPDGGTTWVRLNEWVGETFDDRFERKELPFVNRLAFALYRLVITKNRGDDTLMQIAEIDLIGPVAPSVDHSSSTDAVYSARFAISDAESAAQAFDDNVDTKWLDHNEFAGPPTVEDPAWIQVDLVEGQTVDTLAITSANDAENRDPENFRLIGSNDGGVTWIEVGSWVGESFDARFERRVFFIGNGFDYTTYRLEVSKNRGDDTLMQIAEIELIGPQ